MRGEGSRWEAKGSLPHIRKATLYQRYRMRPLRLLCFSCVLTLRKVEIPTWAQRHIVRRHYPKRKHGKRSMSYEKVIPPHSLFNIVIDLLRSDLKASEKQHSRYIFYYTFPFNVGIFPNRGGAFCETKTIKIVCNYTKCPKCARHWPSAVVTTYPCKNKTNHLKGKNGYRCRES